MIIVSAQLEDWGETSARQAIALTEYFISHYAVDETRVYAAGYSAGGETMSQAVSMRPDLYAAYLHAASQWDGDYSPVAENEWRFISTWQRVTSTTVLHGRAKRLKTCVLRMKHRIIQRKKSTNISDSRCRTRPILLSVALRVITTELQNIVFDDQQVISWILAQHKS